MFCHGSSWFTSWFVMFLCHCFVMVRHGSLSWFTVMVHCHGSSWFTVMVRHGLSWFTVMVHHGSLSWFIMVHCHGSSWFVMVHCHGLSWFVMVHCHGSLSWFTVMVHCHGSLSWFVMVCHGSLSWFCHGSSWFVMCYSLKFSRKGHVTLNSANQILKFTIKSHLMRPLKSSAKNGIRGSTEMHNGGSALQKNTLPELKRIVPLFSPTGERTKCLWEAWKRFQNEMAEQKGAS